MILKEVWTELGSPSLSLSFSLSLYVCVCVCVFVCLQLVHSTFKKGLLHATLGWEFFHNLIDTSYIPTAFIDHHPYGAIVYDDMMSCSKMAAAASRQQLLAHGAVVQFVLQYGTSTRLL